MYHCPICEKENTSLQCSCGFDASRDYEDYPTLAALSETTPSRQIWAEKLEHQLKCSCCGSFLFRVNPETGVCTCADCGEEVQLNLSGKKQPKKDILLPSPKICPIAAGKNFTLVIREDGTPFIAGPENNLNEEMLRGCIALAGGGEHALGLRPDGTVAATGRYSEGQCKTRQWKDIIAVAAGSRHSVGLTAHGTVVAIGKNNYGQCDVDQWTDIVSIAAGYNHTVGLRKDGTVVAIGDNSVLQCDVSGWTDITAIAAGELHTLGLKKDGTVVCATRPYVGLDEVKQWKNIVQIAAGRSHCVGLTADGTVMDAGDGKIKRNAVNQWQNIIAIAANGGHTVALADDGTVLAAGKNNWGQCNINNMKLHNP